MTAVVRHQLVMTTPDDPAYENKPSDWNADHVLSGLVAPNQGGTGVDFSASTGWIKVAAGTFSANASIPSGDISGLGTMAVQNANSVAITGGTVTGISQLTVSSGTLTASTPISWTQTWNNAAVSFVGADWAVTDTASSASSLIHRVTVGGSQVYALKSNGVGEIISLRTADGFDVYSPGAIGNINFRQFIYYSQQLSVGSGVKIAWSANNGTGGGDCYSSLDTGMGRGGANSIVFGGGTPTAGSDTSRTSVNKAVTGIANNTATATFTVTVPNASHSASLMVRLVGALGAGGAVGAGEATGTISYDFAIARTSGVATVVSPSVAYGSATSSVAGAASITISAAASAVSGGSGATQTFTVDVTIARGSGASTNHTCLCYGELLNANASGVTIA